MPRGAATSRRTRSSPWRAAGRRSSCSARWDARTPCATSRRPASSSSASPPRRCWSRSTTAVRPSSTATTRPCELGIATEPSETVAPPRVAESPASIECRLHQIVEVGHAFVVFGRVTAITVVDDVLVDGLPSFDLLRPVSRLGGPEWGASAGDVPPGPPDERRRRPLTGPPSPEAGSRRADSRWPGRGRVGGSAARRRTSRAVLPARRGAAGQLGRAPGAPSRYGLSLRGAGGWAREPRRARWRWVCLVAGYYVDRPPARVRRERDLASPSGAPPR